MKGSFVMFRVLAVFLLMTTVHIAAPVSTHTYDAAGYVQEEVVTTQEETRPEFEGAYRGQLVTEGQEGELVEVRLEVRAVDGNEYRATLYYGGLPEERSGSIAGGDTVEFEGTYEDFTLRLKSEAVPFSLQYIHGRFTALDTENSYQGHLDRVVHVRLES